MGSIGQPASHSRQDTTIRRLLKVNHGGEYGAIRIYRAQLAIARRIYPEVAPLLDEILRNELRHFEAFTSAMPSRGARPCRLMGLWSCGGLVLGACTALLGRHAIWTCTAAVEHSVHRHMVDQLKFLANKDAELHALVEGIQLDELRHLDTASAHSRSPAVIRTVLYSVVFAVTDVLIWLSTSGDSVRLRRDLKRQ